MSDSPTPALDAAGRRAAAYVADRLTATFNLDPTVVLVDYNAGTVLVPVDTLTALLDAWDTTAASRRAPTACTSCGSSLARCDSRISRRLPACCVRCARTDTHNDTPSGYADRVRANAVGPDEGHGQLVGPVEVIAKVLADLGSEYPEGHCSAPLEPTP